ncbi:MAG: sigma-70 family RNA polymerase sigma factor [Planctomycetota bacterium]|nr:MAG: sigma-70 family RNA polymerase sigma factor [Planctomycetota bacterium]
MPEQKQELDPTHWLEKHGDVLFAHALRRLGNRDAAEEVVQETFLAALKGRDNYRQDGSEGAWLMGILKRKVIDALRARSQQATNVEDEDSLMANLFDANGHWSETAKRSGPLRLDSIERGEFRQILRECLRGLPPRQAAVFTLREIQEEPADNVCKELGITPSNLWVLMHRARLRLAECIKSRWSMGEA